MALDRVKLLEQLQKARANVQTLWLNKKLSSEHYQAIYKDIDDAVVMLLGLPVSEPKIERSPMPVHLNDEFADRQQLSVEETC